MKTTKSTLGSLIVSIVTMLFTTGLYAGSNLYVYPIEASRKAMVELSLPVRSDVSIYVLDSKDRPIYNENLDRVTHYKRLYDFSGLKTGMYKIISDSRYLKTTKTIFVDENSIEVVSTDYFHRPVFEMKENILSIRYPNSKKSEIRISISDANRTYYEGKMPGTLQFNKSFDLRKLLPGEYTVLFKVKNYEFAYYITINREEL